ncbi:MAG: hypothetical protein KTR27_02555 [Leptolyngbyaceae cyanobacterium MAG.088]|nr:hypothetical protein [Leptolyngbyaceae cyanobacterium MAG.088]
MKPAPFAPTFQSRAASSITIVSLAVSLLVGATGVKAAAQTASTASLPGTKADESSLPQLNGSPTSTNAMPITPFPEVAPPETPLPAVIETPLPEVIETPLPEVIETTVSPLPGSGFISVDPVETVNTVLSFRTRDYSVRVTGSPGNYFMSLFNRRTSRQEFRDIPALDVRPDIGNNNPRRQIFKAEQGDLTYTAFDNANGVTTLRIAPSQLDDIMPIIISPNVFIID